LSYLAFPSGRHDPQELNDLERKEECET